MRLIRKNKKAGILLTMMLLATAFVWAVSSHDAQATPSLGETLLVGDANADDLFDVRDLVRIEQYSNGETTLQCTLDGDLNVDGTIGSNDDVRCREMLVTGNHSLLVDVTTSDYAKKVEDTDGYYMYYDLKKGLKAGQTLTFKIELPEAVADYGVYGYYAGSEEWLELAENTSASGEVTNTNTYRLVPNVDITQVQVRVVNKSTNEAVKFRIYDIQVYASSAGGVVTDMEVCYQQSTEVPVVFGTDDTLDLTKFSVNTASQDLTYTWSIKKSDGTVVASDLDMTKTAYKLTATGTYEITATVDKDGYAGSASQSIYVVAPEVYVGYDNGVVENTGADTSAVASMKGLTENDSNACTSTSFEEYTGTVTYVAGIDGDANGAVQVNRQTGAVTVVDGYTLPTNNKFTISTWFNVADDSNITTGSGGYLFGNASSDGTSGFSVTLKRPDTTSGIYQLRIKLGNNGASFVEIDLERYGWNNLTLACENDTLTVYMNGAEVEDISLPEGYSFGTTPVAFGAYPVESGKTFTYVDRAIYYDDVQLYNEVLDENTIRAIAASNAKGADVIVDYTDGTLKNTGYSDAEVKVYHSNKTAFTDYSDDVTYVEGFQGESNGAIKSNHVNGPNTAVEKYNFGTDDFTISTWFNVPKAGSLHTGDCSYIMGTCRMGDTTGGFGLTLRRNSSDTTFSYKFMANGSSSGIKDFTGFTYNEWHNWVVVREGTTLTLYFDGDAKYTMTIAENTSFGSNTLSLGAYANETYGYQNADIYYDDLRIYDSVLSVGDIKNMYNSKDASPAISVSYTDGSMNNAGNNDKAAVGAYHLSQTKSATNNFVSSEILPFTTGAAGDFYGAFATTHRDGSYTVVRDHVFGAKNFTINTWFNLSGQTMPSTDGGYYLLGTSHTDGSEGFSLVLKNNTIRVRMNGTTVANSNSVINVSWESNKWYHLSLRRDGQEMTLWRNGEKIWTDTSLAENFDFGTADLSFGGHPGFTSDYKNTVTSYDELRIYNVALSDEVIQNAANTTLADTTTNATDRSAETTNTDLFYMNGGTGRRKAWDPGVIYIEEGEYAGLYCLYVAHENQIKVSTSTDLVNWSEPVVCYSPLEETGTWMQNYVWAPEVVYEDGTYYLFFSAQMKTDASDNYNDGYKYLGVATSTDPTKGFAGSSTPLFGSGVGSGTNYADQGFIDAHPFVDPVTSTKYLYMTRNRDGESTTNIIAVVKMNSWTQPDYSTYKELTKVGYTTVDGTTETKLEEGEINEAPQVLYRDGKYYLTLSINAADNAGYAVVQAVGTDPMGPFTKLQPSEGGLILGANLFDTSASNKMSGTGHHCFVEVEDELFIMYHQHIDPSIPADSEKILSLDRVYWTTNADGDIVLKSNGPTRSMQPMPAFASGYSSLSPLAAITDSKSDASVQYLNDELIKYNSDDVAGQYEVTVSDSETVTMTMTFGDYVKARALLLYNSYSYDSAFASVKNVVLSYRKNVDGVAHTGKMTLNNSSSSTSAFDYNFETWSYDETLGTYLSTGAPMVLEFTEMEINEVTIEFVPQSGATSLAISEMMLLGQEIETPDVHVTYNGGRVNYMSSDVAAKIGIYALDSSKAFVAKTGVTYTEGVDGTANSAIVTNHANGPYTVLNGYNFGTNNFTISTWFKVPASGSLHTGNGSYIMGTQKVDTDTDGFRITLRRNSADTKFELQFKAAGQYNQLQTCPEFAYGQWNHLVVVREGNELSLYVNGSFVETLTLPDDFSFGSKVLSLGAYSSESWGYKDANIYYDDIQVYGSALTESKIQNIANQY